MDKKRATNKKLTPPKSWNKPDRHFHEVLCNPWYKLIYSIMTSIFWSTFDFFKNEKFDPALMPVTTESISSPIGIGSDSQPVLINLFGKDIYLADSMQFNLEYLLRQGSKGVYFIMPTFRGENPDCRHLNQFFHIEAELVGSLDEVMDLVNRLLLKCISNLLSSHSETLINSLGNIDHLNDVSKLNSYEFPIITFKEAVQFLKEEKDGLSFIDGKPINLTSIGEKILADNFGGIVWVINFPRLGSPFYQMTDSKGEFSVCADLLLGIGEIVGAGQRALYADDLIEELRIRKIDQKNYDWYINMKREYPLKTSGFGMGLERLILWVLDHNDIRDVPLIPRMKGNIMTP